MSPPSKRCGQCACYDLTRRQGPHTYHACWLYAVPLSVHSMERGCESWLARGASCAASRAQLQAERYRAEHDAAVRLALEEG